MKAILIIDMPKDCWDCPLHRNSWDEDNEEIMICRGTYMESHYGEIPSWCPLKPMPNKKEEISIDDTKISLKVNSHVILHQINFEKAVLYAKQRGWNDCLDEILGEQE